MIELLENVINRFFLSLYSLVSPARAQVVDVESLAFR